MHSPNRVLSLVYLVLCCLDLLRTLNPKTPNPKPLNLKPQNPKPLFKLGLMARSLGLRSGLGSLWIIGFRASSGLGFRTESIP